MSRTLNPAERNYEIYDKELLAIVSALKEWRHYLLDADEKFEIWTDHENLKYFREPQKLNGRQARWYLRLQDYDFTLKHVPGKSNTKADLLSRIYHSPEMPDDPLVTMIKKDWIHRTTEEEESTYSQILLRAELFLDSPFHD